MGYLKAFIIASLGVLSAYLGGFDLLLKSVLMLTILDYITGIFSAVYNKKLNSQIGFGGFIKKLFIYFTIALSVIIQNVIGNAIPLRDVVILFYIMNESLSILENVGKVIEYPPKLKEVIEQLNEDK